MELLAVPNVSVARSAEVDAIAAAFAHDDDVRLLDVHADPDHGRSVFTLAGPAGPLARALTAGAAEALRVVDLAQHRGSHPHVGAVDVMPVVHLTDEQRGAACAEALVVADSLARELELPVFLYGVLAGGRTRTELRRGGPGELAVRVQRGELRPDFGPPRIDPARGAALVAARPPLVAFNLELAPPATVETARAVAAAIREDSPGGLPGVRALGIELTSRGVAQVSTNVEDHRATTLAAVVEAVRSRAAVSAAELVGLAPRATLEGFPKDVELRGFDPTRHVVENALGLP